MIHQEVDVSIKRNKKNYRKKKYVNQLGDKFEFPDQCKNSHKTKRFNCSSCTIDDVLEFRSKIYSTDDKITQDKTISEYLIGKEAKRKANEVRVSYLVEQISGERVTVCKNFFIQVSGFSENRILNIVKQIKRFGEVKEKRGGDRRSFEWTGKQIVKLVQKSEQEIYKEQTHILLPDQEYIPTSADIKVERDSDNSPLISLATEKRKKKLKKKQKVKKINSNPLGEDPVAEETKIPVENLLVEPKVEILDCDISERCRICLNGTEGESEKHVFLFDEFSADETFANLVEFCLGLKLIANDGLPQYICRECLERVHASHKLKMDSQSTEKYLESYKSTVKTKIEPVENFENTSKEESDNLDFLDMQQENEDDEIESLSDRDLDDKTEETEKPIAIVESQSAPKLPARCYLCDKEFEATPKIHFEVNHRQIGKFSCKYDKCSFEIENLWHLNLHYQVHAEDVKLCNFCGKVFTRGSFLYHKSHCGREEEERKKFRCRFCPNSYSRNHVLKVHERIHTNERPFSCNICSASFTMRTSLKKHMLSHGAKPDFTCFCGKGFVHKFRMKAHQESCLKNKSFMQ